MSGSEVGDARPPIAALSFAALDGWDADDHAAAFACFRSSAVAEANGLSPLRPARPRPPLLRAALQAALAVPSPVDAGSARLFFEHYFAPASAPSDGFYTGYYEPVLDGALQPDEHFTAPILARPDDLRTFSADESRPEALRGLTAARVTRDGALEPYPDRTAIEAAVIEGGPLFGGHRPLVWLRDWVEVFLVHVQGSARVRVAGGPDLRLTYAGRNGHPYTSIGRMLVEAGEIAPEHMSLATLKDWLRRSGQAPGQAARTLMGRNASYIFFDAAPDDGADIGPVGGEGVALTPLRSIAVDRLVHPYGLPVWVDVDLPGAEAGPDRLRGLMIAQDTGSAIVGPARADLFAGSGDAAGTWAGGVRHRGRFVVLQPRHAPGAGS